LPETSDVRLNMRWKGWRLVRLCIGRERPGTTVDWLWMLWGFDVWIGRVPLLKLVVLANLVMWVLMWGSGLWQLRG